MSIQGNKIAEKRQKKEEINKINYLLFIQNSYTTTKKNI